MPIVIARSATSGASWRAMNTKSSAESSLRASTGAGVSSTDASFARCAGVASSFAGDPPSPLYARPSRERLARPIDDPAAVRGDLEFAAVARATLLLQKHLVEALQPQRARGEHAEGERERAEHDSGAEPRQRGRGRAPHRSAPERTISTRDDGGSSMPSEPRAI